MNDTAATTISPVRARRLALELPQQAVAAQSGVARSTIVAIELYGHRPRRSTYERLAKVLKTTVEQLGGKPPVESLLEQTPEAANQQEDIELT